MDTFFVIYGGLCHTVSAVSSSLVVTCCESADLLYIAFSCVLSISGVVLDCIDS